MKISQIERRILIYNKVKKKGMTYNDAKKELEEEMKFQKELTKKLRDEKKVKNKKTYNLFGITKERKEKTWKRMCKRCFGLYESKFRESKFCEKCKKPRGYKAILLKKGEEK